MPKDLIDPLEEFPKVKSPFIREPLPQNLPGEAPSKANPVNPMIFYARQKSTEEKVYILLYRINGVDESDMESKVFEICIGRTAAYADIKDKLQSGIDVDVHRSIVITETIQTETKTGNTKYFLMPFEECISVYAFCVSLSEFFDTDDFDIEDYSEGDIPEDNKFDTASRFLTAEQLEYRALLEQSVRRESFIDELRQSIKESENNLI